MSEKTEVIAHAHYPSSQEAEVGRGCGKLEGSLYSIVTRLALNFCELKLPGKKAHLC